MRRSIGGSIPGTKLVGLPRLAVPVITGFITPITRVIRTVGHL